MKVKVLVNFTRGKVYEAGTEVEMPEEDFPDMSRAGFVTLLGTGEEIQHLAMPRVPVEEAVVRPPEAAVTRRRRG